jgi:hypothetical protein
MTVLAQRKVAVDAEQAISLFRESVFRKSGVKASSFVFRTVLPSSSVDMVDGQEFKMRILTTFAFPAVGIYNSLLQNSVVLAMIFLPLVAFLLFHQNLLSVFDIVFTGVLSLLLGVPRVVVLPALFLLFAIVFVKLSVLSLPVIRMRDFEFLHGAFACCENVGHVLRGSLHLLLKGCQHGFSHRDWRSNATRTISQHRQLVVGGSRQQCRGEKFSLIDLDAEMQTGRKASNGHRERLSERTSLADGAIVWASGNCNRKRTAEMTVPCFA